MKAKLFTAAALTLAGLSFMAGRHNPSAPAELQQRTATPVVERQKAADGGAVIPTPLVEKLIPKKAIGPVDGQLSAGGNFSYSEDRNIWVPVDKGNPRYTHNKQPVTAAHLIAEHNHHPDCANGWSQEELDIAHANDHAAERAVTRQSVAPATYSSACPTGQCGNTKVGRGLFGRWR